MYRNWEKELGYFSQKENLLSYFIFCFLITFIWRGQDLMNGNTFTNIFAKKRNIFINLIPRGCYFYRRGTAARKVLKR